MAINPQLLDHLVCPKCKGELVLSEQQFLTCEQCQLVYPIRNDVPIMLIDEAVSVEA